MNKAVPLTGVEIFSGETVKDQVAKLISSERDMLNMLLEQIVGSGWQDFSRALHALNGIEGKIVISGMGKSGHIAKKVAATMSSLGTPAFFVHPAEASHGDLGMIGPKDGLLAFSNSGNTAELRDIILRSVALDIPVIGVTMGESSFLAQRSTVVLKIPRMQEGCCLGLAPTSSTTAQIAIGDALSVGLSWLRGFKPENFKTLHPAGTLGLTNTRVSEVMLTGDDVPLVAEGDIASSITLTMARKASDVVGVIDARGCLVGIIYAMRMHAQDTSPARDIMTSPAPVVQPGDSLATAHSRMDATAIRGIFVVEGERPVGFVRR